MRNLKWLVMGAITVVVLLPSATLAMQEPAPEGVKVKFKDLPQPVKEAVWKNCRKCSVAEATREVENGVTIYDFEFKRNRGEMDVAEDGTVISRETPVSLSKIPAAARKAIRKEAKGASIKQIERDQIRAELKDGQINKLDKPKYVYEAEMVKGKNEAEMQVSPTGEVIEAPEWKTKGAKGN